MAQSTAGDIVQGKAGDIVQGNSIFLQVCQHSGWTEDEQGLGNT